MMCLAPASSRIRATAIPAAPTPEITMRMSSSRRPVRVRALNSAAITTTAVPCWSSWNTGMSRSALSRSSISKQRGAEMSSRLMPPKVGAIASTASTISSGSRVSRQIGKASIPANSLNSIALPSITGLADSAGHLAEHPRTVVDLDSQGEAVLGAGDGRHGPPGCYAARGRGLERCSETEPLAAAEKPARFRTTVPDELFLIDGNSLAYRAFFALPESIATSTGVPTNTIFGFASMLVKILTDYGPKATVVVWDAGDTGRREVYPEYKAQRTTRPDLLKEQWPHLEPLVEALGYKNLAIEGFEADDVIASIVEAARHEQPPIPVMVVTGDRDAYQLVGDGVKIMTTSRGITDTRVYDREGVVERYGIPPELIPDFIGLKGDTSDNIPGVPGIGDKTAAELLQRFGSLEGVLEHVDDISGAKRKQNLIEHADDARLSKLSSTITRDMPLHLGASAFTSQPP